jgi:hypothetical protein
LMEKWDELMSIVEQVSLNEDLDALVKDRRTRPEGVNES